MNCTASRSNRPTERNSVQSDHGSAARPRRRFWPALALCLSALGALPMSAAASAADMLATTVPASACVPIDSTHASKVRLSNAAWVFRGNNIGAVQFYCPLVRNAYTMSDGSDDNDVTAFRVYYRDSDGTGNRSRVTARLVYRKQDGLHQAGDLWNSNSSGATGNTRQLFVNVHDMQFDAVYSFYVTLYRAGTDEDPALSGFDFSFPAIP